MASPFSIFRKNVKPLLAVFVVMLMLSWVVGDSLIGYFTGVRNGIRTGQCDWTRTTAVSWDGGSLNNKQVADMVMRRRNLNEFLRQVEGTGARTAIEAGVEPRPLHVERMLGPETPQQGIEQSVVQTRLFADAARKAGMRVSDEAIVQYLDELGRGNVTRDDMRTILSHFRTDSGQLSIDAVLNALREEMLARNFINSNQYSFLTVTPEQRWKDWLRVNDRVVVEAAAIPVDKYLVDVKEPTEAELTAFFEKYKDRESSPELAYGTTELPSATPGFRIPRKIDLEFIEANFDSALAKAEEKVTEEEIAKFYEENKDPMFVKADMGLMEDKGEKKDATVPDATPPADGATPEVKPEAKPGDDAAKATEPETKAAPADARRAPRSSQLRKPMQRHPRPRGLGTRRRKRNRRDSNQRMAFSIWSRSRTRKKTMRRPVMHRLRTLSPARRRRHLRRPLPRRLLLRRQRRLRRPLRPHRKCLQHRLRRACRPGYRLRSRLPWRHLPHRRNHCNLIRSIR